MPWAACLADWGQVTASSGHRGNAEAETAHFRPSSALEAAPKRGAADNRHPLHDHKAGALQMLDQALRYDFGHDLVGVVNALAALEAQGEGERRGKVGRVGGRELVGVGHRRTIVEERERSKNMRTAIVFVAMLLALPVRADSPDISARRLLSNWKSQDPMMSRVAEVIAAAFSGGLSWRGSHAGKEIYCPPRGLKGHEIMISFEQFLNDNPDMAERPYGDAMAATLSRTFPCQAQ